MQLSSLPVPLDRSMLVDILETWPTCVAQSCVGAGREAECGGELCCGDTVT